MKTAVITGASYGIGKAVVEGLLDSGWKVYGISRSKPAYDNDRFVWIECDLAKSDKIAACLDVVGEAKIDALISNAGVIELEMASAVSQKSYEHTFSVNVLAPMLLVSALMDKVSGGTIISVSSVSDRIPEADVALYASSKAANTLYFNSLADELKAAKVYTLLPDYVDTPMLRETQKSNEAFDWDATIKPEEVATLMYELMSGGKNIPSGANIILVTEALKDDLKSVEKLYGYNTGTRALTRL